MFFICSVTRSVKLLKVVRSTAHWRPSSQLTLAPGQLIERDMLAEVVNRHLQVGEIRCGVARGWLHQAARAGLCVNPGVGREQRARALCEVPDVVMMRHYNLRL